MPVSPRDFELYSRMTGASMPTDAVSRARMAPDVYDFTRNFAKSPNILDKAGDMVKGIGRTFQRGIGAGIQADLTEAKTPYRPTSQNYGQRVMETQTNVGLQDRKATQGVEITGDVSTMAEEISGGQASNPDMTSVDRDVKKEVQAVAGSVPLTTKEMLQGGGSDNMFTRNLEKTIAGDGMKEIGEIEGGKAKLAEFTKKTGLIPGLVDPALESAVGQRDQFEEKFGYKGYLPSFDDHTQMVGGEDNSRALSQPFINEVEEIKVDPTPGSTTNNVDNFVNLIEGSRTDLFPDRFGGKSMGVSYVPPTNGDAQVTFNFTDKKTPDSTTLKGIDLDDTRRDESGALRKDVVYGDASSVGTGTFGVDQGGMDYLQNQLASDNFGTYYNRAKKEAKEGKRRQAGEIFGFVSEGDRVIPDQFSL